MSSRSTRRYAAASTGGRPPKAVQEKEAAEEAKPSAAPHRGRGGAHGGRWFSLFAAAVAGLPPPVPEAPARRWWSWTLTQDHMILRLYWGLNFSSGILLCLINWAFSIQMVYTWELYQQIGIIRSFRTVYYMHHIGEIATEIIQ
ncbi:hypothetical protein C8Q79DRAFT_930030 [Trametes meyenii]|nr:hypothetical protein C8Q79DRAFT_930030 [Trametes meyenii]